MSKSFEAVEKTNYEKARKMYDNWDNIPFKNTKKLALLPEKNKLRDYLKKNTSKDGKRMKIETCYMYARGKKGTSRQTVVGVGLQNLMREIRHTIADEYYDIDMVNSEPTLLLNYCIKAKQEHTAIKYYVNNRETCIKDIIKTCKLTREDAKKAVLAVINGGTRDYPVKWFREFVNEIKQIHKYIGEHPAYSLRLEKKKESKQLSADKKYYSPIGSLMSEIFHEIENECLLKCLDYCKQCNVSVAHAALVFDGFMMYKKDVSDISELVVGLSDYVTKKTGYEVKYIVKAMDEAIDLSNFDYNEEIKIEPEELIAEDDDAASDLLLEVLEGQVFSCCGQIWLRTQTERIYTCDKETIEDEMISRCMALRIEKKGKTKNVSFSTTLCGAVSISKTARYKIRRRREYRNDSFVDDMIKYTRDKIFFRNGYIQMIRGKMETVIEQDYDDYEIMTPVRISRDVPDFSTLTNEIKNELRDRVLLPIFGSNEVLLNYMETVARGITGHIEDKDWVIISGLRNCGKGVMAKLNSFAFGTYYSETSANNFLMERSHTLEDAKKYSWIAQNRWTRILGTSEVKMDDDNKHLKIDGTLIKGKLSSGGDPVRVRDLYEKEYGVIPQCRLFMMVNDLPPIYPPDAVQTLTKINCPHEFIDEEDYAKMRKKKTLNPNSKLRDPTIKDYVGDLDVCTAYLEMVMNAFKTEKVKKCKIVKQETETLKEDLGDEKAIMNKYFEFTHDPADKLTSSELVEFHKTSDIKVSISKLRELMKFYGAVDAGKTLQGKNGRVRGYTCVKFSGNGEKERVKENDDFILNV